MFKGQRILGVIPARGGSKGLPGKNIADVAGKPMIAWSIAAARASQYLDRAVVSSDDPAVIEVARAHGGDVPFVRPGEIAQDTTAIEPVLFHALDSIDGTFDYIVLLQPTSPLRRDVDIDRCIEACIDAGAPAALSIVAQETPPEWMFRVRSDRRLMPIFPEGFGVARRRQDLPEAWAINGAVYVMNIDWYRKTRNFLCEETVAYVMPREHSVCVDTPEDMFLARALAEKLMER